LCRRLPIAHNKGVVQGAVESDLNQHCIFRLCDGAIWIGNDLG
jgi:hypothetical protein